MKLSKNLLEKLYKLGPDNPRHELFLKRAVEIIYPILVKEFTYISPVTNQRSMVGACRDDAMYPNIRIAERFINQYEATSQIDFCLFDQVIWMCHNHGSIIHHFLECDGEADGIKFLNELGGIVR